MEPNNILVTSFVGNVYIADYNNDRIRKITVSTGVISTIAGTGVESYGGDNGQATSAAIKQCIGVAVDSSGNVYIADTGNHRIRKVTVSTGVITTIAGTGTCATLVNDGMDATSASLCYPTGVYVDTSLNIYIADWIHSRVRKVTAVGSYGPTIRPSEIPSSIPTAVPTVVPPSAGPSTAAPRYSTSYWPKYARMFIVDVIIL